MLTFYLSGLSDASKLVLNVNQFKTFPNKVFSYTSVNWYTCRPREHNSFFKLINTLQSCLESQPLFFVLRNRSHMYPQALPKEHPWKPAVASLPTQAIYPLPSPVTTMLTEGNSWAILCISSWYSLNWPPSCSNKFRPALSPDLLCELGDSTRLWSSWQDLGMLAWVIHTICSWRTTLLGDATWPQKGSKVKHKLLQEPDKQPLYQQQLL